MKAFHEVRSYDSNFMMWHSAYRNISFLAHWHNELELIYIREGTCLITVNDDTFPAQAGSLILCSSGDIHYCDEAAPQNALEFLIFDPGLLNAQYRDVHAPQTYLCPSQLEALGMSDALEAIFRRIPMELQAHEPYYQEIATAMLREFWYRLKRVIPEQPYSENRRGGLMQSFHTLLCYLDAHYTEPLTLESAANCLGYTPGHFSKTFKKLAGINFVTYLSMIRVEQACTRLKKDEERMVDIAHACGFNNLRTFNRTFKEITGYTPTQFKKLPNGDSYMLTYYKRRSTEQTLAVWDSPTVISHLTPPPTK